MILSFMEFAQITADVVQPFALPTLGAALVGWLCTRVEKRLDRLEHTLKGLSMALLMDLASRKVLSPVAQKMVEEQLRKMGVREDPI
jgi:hypothetical protein